MLWCRVASLASLLASTPAHAQSADPLATGPKNVRLLVIGPAGFADAARPLIRHKDATGMPASYVTIESLHTLVVGKDEPERIKMVIAAGVKSHGVRYVMLVGDASLCPVRFRRVTQVPPDAALNGTYNPSELYYSNLFRKHTPGAGDKASDPAGITTAGEFDNWDASGDGVFNEQHWAEDAVSFNPDAVDGCPDVALGRVPAHTPAEFAAYVAKIIRYETLATKGGPLGGSMTFIADRNYAGSTGSCDALLAAAAKSSMPAANAPIRLEFIPGVIVHSHDQNGPPANWNIGTFPALDDAVLSSSWVTYFGHAAPGAWAISGGEGWYDMTHIRGLKPANHAGATERVNMPIVVTIGCESGRFAQWQPSSEYNDARGVQHQFVHDDATKSWTDTKAPGTSPDKPGPKIGPRLIVPQPSPFDLPQNKDLTMACAWLFAGAAADTQPGSKPDPAQLAGAIAFFGESLVCENDKGYELLTDMFDRYGSGDRVLGDVWMNAQRTYWLHNRASENVFRHPRIYLGLMTFFGDPSLRLNALP